MITTAFARASNAIEPFLNSEAHACIKMKRLTLCNFRISYLPYMKPVDTLQLFLEANGDI